MAEDRLARVRALFDQAADLSPAEQCTFLDDACRDDAALRAEVERLLVDDTRLRPGGDNASFLNSPLVRTPEEPTSVMRSSAPVAGPTFPPRIGHYRIIRLLGEGGMGTVYEAEQESPRRPVALKVVRSGFLSPTLLKRFNQEAQILGRLRHPGIAQIYEAGMAEDGRPFFALELIRGMSLHQFARDRQLDTAARLGLLAQVCDAVQHAHDQGIIHRDLKPGNILVDETGRPKVLDFGVARATDADLQTPSGRTQPGQLVGTLSYMSPEQVSGDPAALDRRSDVYSLGVILFELLANRLPYHLEHLPLPEVARVIREEEPSRLGSINGSFRGDVEIIVGKALEKDKVRRYATAGELATDIRRYLNNEPILARPPSALYQLRKFARRHKALTTSLAVAAFLLVLIAASSVGLAAYFKEQEAIQRDLVKEKGELAERNQRLADDNKSAREMAEKALQKAETTLVDMQTARGLLAGERGDAGLAMLWFAQAAEQAASDPQRQEDNRLRARNWLRNATLPVGAFSLGGFPEALEFRPGGDLLLMRTLRSLFLWDWRADKLLPWIDREQAVSAACWSPDGEWLALGLPSGEVQIRSVPDGKLVHQLKHSNGITALAFSPNGLYLAVASNVVRVWDVQASKFLPGEWEHPAPVFAVAFNRKGDRLVAACRDYKARVFAVGGDPDLPAPLFPPLPHDPKRPSPPAFIDGDRGLVTISGNNQLTWWSAESGKSAGAGVITTKPFSLTRVVASPGGSWFATGGWSVGQVWNAADAKAKPLLLDHTNRVEDFAFSPDGGTLLTVSWDQTARLWSLPEGKEISPPLAHMGTIVRCDLSRDNAYLATAQEDGLVRVWKRPTPGVVRHDTDHGGRRSRISFDGQLAAPGLWHEEPTPSSVVGPERLVVLETATGKPAGPVISLPGALVDSCVCADNRTAAAVSVKETTGWLSVADVPTGRLVFDPVKLPNRPLSVAARPDSPQLAVLCREGELLVFDSRTGERVLDLRHETWNRTNERWPRVEYSPDGKNLVTLTDEWNNVIEVRDAATGRLRFPPLRLSQEQVLCRSFAISADGQLLATAVTGKNTAQVWDLASGQALSPPLPHPGDAYGLWHVSFSPDGRHVLTSHRDGQARLWDWKAGRLACPPLKHPDQVFASWFAPDGRHVITACSGAHGMIHVWELTTGKLVAPPLLISPTAAEHTPPSYVSLSPDGKRAFASFSAASVRAQINLADLLSNPDLSTEDFRLIAELSSAKAIELGDESRLTNEQWLERWALFRKKLPDLGRPTSEETIAMHRKTARALVETGQPLPALAHLRQALLESKGDPKQLALWAEIYHQRAEVFRQVGKTEAAENDLKEARFLLDQLPK
jgi:serine/threonine protein kinase/WD40 repeat protein